ncbi:MAG TPA: PP2C family protein-serine/threonine phosphatase [Chloroflexia bacterium]|nr:PP2C family protein-serine/threonine phosphatase [Chloroflexia bacterium]
MLEHAGQQSCTHATPTISRWENKIEKRVYIGSASLSLLLMTVALALGVSSDREAARLPVAAQFGVALLVFSFIATSDLLTDRINFKPGIWRVCAALCALVVVITAFFTGENFNVMLAPLLVSVAERWEDRYGVIKLGIGALVVVTLELFLSRYLGVNASYIPGAGTSLTALAALTIALATATRRYRNQVNDYIQDAANKASEMSVAHEIQASLMPPTQFISGNWTLVARSIPAREVGGDFYEYVNHPHLAGTVSGIAIGDVAGKGIPAALQMAVVRTLFRVEARRRIFPGETLMSVNAALQAERSFGMVTMLYAFIDLNTNKLYVANAGHNYPLVINGDLEEIKIPGLPLGIDDGIEYEEKVYQIMPGTSVIFYTDGLVEAMNNAGELFTFERLKEVVQANRKLNPAEMVSKILDEIASFTLDAPQSDDMTLLVLQYHPQAVELSNNQPEAEVVVAGMEANRTGRGGSDFETEDDGINWI